MSLLVVLTGPALGLATLFAAWTHPAGWPGRLGGEPRVHVTNLSSQNRSQASAASEVQAVAAVTPAAVHVSTPRADAGEDQLGLVGRKLVLDGYRSEPRGAVGYRWIQVFGPQVQQRTDEGSTLSFVPPEPGLYRFLLVVGSGQSVSEPDLVDVQVGTWTAAAGTAPASPATPGPSREVVPADPATLALGSPPGPLVPPFQPPGLERVAQNCLGSVVGGPERAEALATDFEAVADRVDLYSCYRDLYSELSRRLEDRVPRDPALRQVWLDRVFGPLTQPLTEELRKDGVDLRSAEGQAATLNTTQRRLLAGQFRRIAEGFRSAAPAAPEELDGRQSEEGDR